MKKLILLSALILCMAACSKVGSNSATQKSEIQKSEISSSANVGYLSEDEILFVRQKAGVVDKDVRINFEALHQNWYRAAQDDPEVSVSSSMNARCELPEFKALVEMGEPIIPLLMEKMLDEKYFFSQLVCEAIWNESGLQSAGSENVAAPQSAQDRAREIVKAWIIK